MRVPDRVRRDPDELMRLLAIRANERVDLRRIHQGRSDSLWVCPESDAAPPSR